MNFGVIFLTGLTIGGLSCLAVQGGLLASVLAGRKQVLAGTLAFLVAKFIAYTLLGFLLGTFGGAINISGQVQTFMQLLSGIYMIFIAFNLLELHPVFRYVVIQPPRFLTKIIRSESRSQDFFAPATLGALTVFIPCGTTLAMEALAISSTSGIQGALIMATFTLGTVPLFVGIGFLTKIMGETFKVLFLRVAAILVIYLGLTSIYGAFVASGVSFSLPQDNFEADSEVQINQNPTIRITQKGYEPDYIRVKQGEPVNLKLINDDGYTCATAFRIPSLGIARNLLTNEEATVRFTPKKREQIVFSCSMGMYRGIIEVI